MGLQIKKATRTGTRLRLALIGLAGSGKTFTALRIAHHLGGRTLLVDTERGSASKYAGEEIDASRFEFDVIELDDFSPDSYVAAIRLAEKEGYDNLILDSLSHAWMGKGGALEMVDNATKRSQSKNSYTAWRDVTPKHNEMVEAIITARLHVIATMRTKMEYVQERDEKTGKTSVRKLGLQPVQRDGLEYEFDVIADLDQNNNLIVGKTRCSALSGFVKQKAGREVAETLKAWLAGGAEPMTHIGDVLRVTSASSSETAQPSEQEDRARKVEDIMTTCKLLNTAGDKVKMPIGEPALWTKTSLNQFIRDELNLEGGIDALTYAQLQQLQGKLSLRLDQYALTEAVKA
jgi:AAA domain